MTEGAAQKRRRAADLYRAYGPAVYRRCLALLQDREAAKRAALEIFVGLVRDIAKQDDPSLVLQRIHGAATLHCQGVLRRRARPGARPEGLVDGDGATEPALAAGKTGDG